MINSRNQPPPALNGMVGSQRIVVLGASGRLGQALASHFREGHTVLALNHDRVDLGAPESIARNLEPLDFDVLILCAALTAVDYCESHEEEAFAVNAEGPREVARICKRKGARLVHISTDFVFEGTRQGLYTETDPVKPISVYGASKCKGEEYVLDVSDANLVVRLSWIFGPAKPAFPEWIIEQASSEFALSLPAEKTGCPTFAPDVAEWLDCLVTGPARKAARGVFHLCNAGSCTWQEWGQHCLDLAAANGIPLKTKNIGATSLDAIPGFVAKRPVNSALSTGKFEDLTGLTPRPWKVALEEHLAAAAPGRQVVPRK